MRDDDGTITGLVGVGRDVSARKERERRFEAVFNNTYQFTGLMEPDGTLVEANTTGLAFTGWDEEDAAGAKLWESPVFRSEAAQEAMREGVEHARDGEFYRTEVELQGENRDAVVDFSIRPITDEDGEVTMLVPEGRDVSKLKERERLLRLLHRLLRHNLRNDLNTIRGYADILEAECENQDLAAYAEHVESAADELVSMSETSREFITLALDFDESGMPVDIRQLLETLVADLRREHPELSVDLSGDESAVIEGDTRLEYLFSELLENAVEHGAADDGTGGPSSRDATADGSGPAVAVEVQDGADAVRVTVADDGPGIPDDEWAAVIEESAVESTQLRHGSGVGLLLSKWVVDRYGGSIEAEGSDGGSRITVRLPKQ